MAVLKMRPDVLVRFLRENERSQAEVRLRTYFFGDLWDKLPEPAKDHLINADRLFYSSEGARQSIFNELRLACEAVLEVLLWEPYHRWLLNRRVLKDPKTLAAALNERRYGTFLGQMLEHLWGAPDFDKFLAEEYLSNRQFIQIGLRKALNELLNLRNPAEHPQQGLRRFSAGEVRNMYRKFLGIGQPGILQKVLAMEPKR